MPLGAIRAVEASVSWAVTVDAPASESNARAPRFWSRFPEPCAEAFDAFSVLVWSRSVCPACGLAHREALYMYSPPDRRQAWQRHTVVKACFDRALSILVVPTAILAPHPDTRCSQS